MNLQSRILQFSRKGYSKIAKPKIADWRKTDGFDFTGQAASDVIKSKLSGSAPVMIARIGASEMELMSFYINEQKGFKKYWKYIKGEMQTCWWDAALFQYTFQITGLFPLNPKTLKRFSQLMLEELPQIDILGSWLKYEADVNEQLSNAIRIPLADIEPYYHVNPWSEVLKGKRVLVIHPFAYSIQKQYANRLSLFADNRILPEFELKTIMAVQSIAGNKPGFKNWFDALDFMKNEITKIEFDIAIIGCGAYGLPLSAYVKKMGKKAVHMGGATQALFGIIGKRWEQNEVARFINTYWIRPSVAETPKNFSSMENGCYW